MEDVIKSVYIRMAVIEYFKSGGRLNNMPNKLFSAYIFGPRLFAAEDMIKEYSL